MQQPSSPSCFPLAATLTLLGAVLFGAPATAWCPPVQSGSPAPAAHAPFGAAWSTVWNGELREVAVWQDPSDPTHHRVWTAEDGGRIRFLDTDGLDWAFQVTPPEVDEPLLDIFFLDGDTGWAVGDGGRVLGTVDHGATWELLSTEIAENQPARLWGIYFIDPLKGWLAGNHVLRYTGDGGNTWKDSSVPNDVFEEYYSFEFAVDATGLLGVVTVEPGKVLYTLDGYLWKDARLFGTDQLPTMLESTFEAWDVAFEPNPASPETARGYFCGEGPEGGRIFRTDDGGRGWHEEEPLDGVDFGILYGITAWPDGNALAVGYGGQVLKRDPSHPHPTERWSSVAPSAPGLPCDPAGPFTAPIIGVDSDPSGTLWAVGAFGYLRKSTDGGLSLQSDIANGGWLWRVDDVSFISADEGWVAGQSAIGHTTDGGSTWDTELCNVSLVGLKGIDCAADGSGVAVGVPSGQNASIYYRARGSPPGWHAAVMPQGISIWPKLYDVRRHDNTNYFAVGQDGIVLRSTTSGVTWDVLTPTPPDPNIAGRPQLRSIAFLHDAHAFVVGDEGSYGGKAWRVYGIQGNTQTWSDISPITPVGPTLSSVDARGSIPSPDVIAVGSSGRVLRWSIASDRFETVPAALLTTEPLRSVITVPGSSDIFIGGNHGTLIRRSGGVWERLDADTSKNVQAFSFPDPLHGFAIGGQAGGTSNPSWGSLADSVLITYQ